MDNRIFNVNGSGREMLSKALELVFIQWGSNTTAKSWMFSEEYGLILCWYSNEGKDNKFPAPLKALECVDIVDKWLVSEEATKVECKEWDRDYDHDGHNTKGWRVYCESWGHVGCNSNAICAIKPVYLWHGK